MMRATLSFWLLIASIASANAQKIEQLKLYAAGDQEIMLRRGYSLTPDCEPNRPTKIAIIVQPKNGTISERVHLGFPNYEKDNVRMKCNEKRVEGVAAFYKANPGFKGVDKMEFAIVYNDGGAKRFKVEMVVWEH